MPERFFKTYWRMSSNGRDRIECRFEGTGIDDFDTRFGVPELRALRIINDWNRRAAQQAHNQAGNQQFTYWLE